jgi:hypothetical protein
MATDKIRAGLIKIAFQYGAKALRLERDSINGCWNLWTHANPTFTIGTFMCLYDSGAIEQVTIEPDGSRRVILVKDEDK